MTRLRQGDQDASPGEAPSNVIRMPGVPVDRIAAAVNTSRAHVIAEHIVATFAGADVGDCAEGLLRVLAAICTANSINRTEALELAGALAGDLGELASAAMEDGAGG